jgi:16S rRNA (cytosine967-C5)-methyltransferase
LSSSKKPHSPLRSTAASVVCSVIKNGRSLTDALTVVEKLDPIDRSLCKQLCYGTLRWYYRLDAILNQLIEKPFRAKDTDIKALALVGLYQLMYLEMPAHAAVSETVDGCHTLRKKWARGLLNAVLRRFIREQSTLETTIDKQINQQYAHPTWLVKQLEEDWGKELTTILEGNNQQAPMTIRVNQKRIDRESYIKQLEEHEITANPCDFNPQGLTLEKAVSVDRLPDFCYGI